MDSNMIVDLSKYKEDFENFFEKDFLKFNEFFRHQLNGSIKTWLIMKINLAVIK